MATETQFRDRVKAELGIVGSSAERGFDDAALLHHIQRAIEEFSLAWPAEVTSSPNVAGGSRSFALSLLTRPLAVEAVEYPVGQWLRQLVDFDVWSTDVTLDHTPPSVAYEPKVYYRAYHLVNASSSTIPVECDGIIVMGAVSYAMLARTAGSAQTLETATVAPLTYQHLRLAQEWREAFTKALDDLRRQRPQRKRMYTPRTGRVRRDVVELPAW